MSIEERKAKYESSALKELIEASGHEICERCYCCDSFWEVENCWACGGFPESDDDEWPEDVCAECGGEGELSFKVCVGGCDKDGNHKKTVDKAEAK